MTLEQHIGQNVTISFKCRDIGNGVESGEMDGVFTGECDSWGKWTFKPDTHDDLVDLLDYAKDNIDAAYAKFPDREAIDDIKQAISRLDQAKEVFERHALYLFPDEIVAVEPI